jgi:hypothetical protein
MTDSLLETHGLVGWLTSPFNRTSGTKRGFGMCYRGAHPIVRDHLKSGRTVARRISTKRERKKYKNKSKNSGISKKPLDTVTTALVKQRRS